MESRDCAVTHKTAVRKKHASFTTDEAAAILVLSRATTVRLLRTINAVPTEEKFWHYGQRGVRFHWLRKDIFRLKRTKSYREAIAKAEANKVKREAKLKACREEESKQRIAVKRRNDWMRSLVVATYKTPEKALGDACEAMKHLNRFAKQKTSQSGLLRADIYELKNKLVCHLCSLGLAQKTSLHIQRIPRRSCYVCDGIGDEECMNCGGTGFSGGHDYELVCFDFLVDGREYTWHQPRELVNWEFQLTECEPLQIPIIDAKENLVSDNNYPAFMMVVKFALSELTESRQ